MLWKLFYNISLIAPVNLTSMHRGMLHAIMHNLDESFKKVYSMPFPSMKIVFFIRLQQLQQSNTTILYLFLIFLISLLVSFTNAMIFQRLQQNFEFNTFIQAKSPILIQNAFPNHHHPSTDRPPLFHCPRCHSQRSPRPRPSDDDSNRSKAPIEPQGFQ
jgi:hypothetical protein